MKFKMPSNKFCLNMRVWYHLFFRLCLIILLLIERISLFWQMRERLSFFNVYQDTDNIICDAWSIIWIYTKL